MVIIPQYNFKTGLSYPIRIYFTRATLVVGKNSMTFKNQDTAHKRHDVAVKNHISFDSNVAARFLVNYSHIAFLSLRYSLPV